MRSIKAVPVEHHYKKRAFLYEDLNTCSHVFLRVGTGKKSFERPYTGPHRIIKRTSDWVFEIDVNGSPRHASVENVKPAYFLRQNMCDPLSKEASSTTDNDVNKETSTGENKETASNVNTAIRKYSRKKKVQFKV